MTGLARHIDPDELIHSLQDHPLHKTAHEANRVVSHATPYNSRYASATALSKFRIPHDGAPADVVHQLLKDELDLDGVGVYSQYKNWAKSPL
jgi:glutamate decarboxylase